MSADSKRAVRLAVLEELVFETVRQYAALWENVQYAQALVEHIERAKVECADSAEEQQQLVDEYTSRAWTRLAEGNGVAAA